MSEEVVKDETVAEATPAQEISEEAYRELEAIVGTEYITRAPVECASYTGRGYGREAYWYQGVATTAACVVLPKTTEEVSRIVKLCNRYDIPYTSGSSFWITSACPWFRTDFLVIDLKRMDDLVIDEKNMYVTLGPSVVFAQLQAELMKRDLYMYVPGGGGSASVIANHLFQGEGILNYRICPWSERRMNGAEWVTPEGDIVQMGSFINDEEHAFWGGGPGPDLLGMNKGNTSWWGTMGIVTRMSVKVYPFQPDELVPEGLGRKAAVSLPPRVRYQNYTLPSEEALQNAMLEIGREQIAAAMNRVPMFWRVIAKVQSRQEFWDMWSKVTREESEATHILRVLFIGYTSQKQLDYEMQVADDIVVKKYGGVARPTKPTDDGTFLYPTVVGMWKPTGFYASEIVGLGSHRCTWQTNDESVEELEKEPYPSVFFEQYHEHPWYTPFNFGRVMYSEFMAYPDCEKMDPANPKFDPNVVGGVLTFLLSEMPKLVVKNGVTNHFGNGFINSKLLLGPTMHNYHTWVQKLKNEFDPKDVCRKGCADAMDVIISGAPVIINDEFKEIAEKVTKAGWKDAEI